MQQLSDAELVQAMSRGDRAALGELFERHAPRLLTVARCLLQDEADSEDLVHDVFLVAFRDAYRFDASRGAVNAWLTVLTRSRALDRLKSARVTRRRDLEADSLDRAAGDDKSRVEERADAQRLVQAFGTLPETQREVLALGYFEGFSSSEIAAECGVPVGTVKSRVRAGMSALRTFFGAETEKK